MSPYSSRIESLVPIDVDPRHVEAYMRIEHSTLDHLSPRAFRREVGIAVRCIEEGGVAAAERAARSFGF